MNLSTSAHALDNPALLAYQLRWSLGTLTVGAGTKPMPVEIEIEGQTQVTSSDNSYQEHVANLAPSRSSEEASAYAIAGGKAVAVTINSSTEVVAPAAAAGQPRVLNSAKNAGVTLAAVDGSGSAAALVRTDGTGESLWIRRTGGAAASDFVQVKGLPRGTMSRPEFVAQPAGAVVVAVNGQLKLVDFQNRVHSIQLPSGISNVSAFSIAPDAHRIAFVSGGKLYFSVITVGDTPTMRGSADPDRSEPHRRDRGGLEFGVPARRGRPGRFDREDRRAEHRRFTRPSRIHPGVRSGHDRAGRGLLVRPDSAARIRRGDGAGGLGKGDDRRCRPYVAAN